MEQRVFLETKGLTKCFGEVLAVDHVSLTIKTGEIRGLIGENGSGKSTISAMISAIHTVTAGEMLIEGKRYRPKNPGDARAGGIAMIVQETGTIDDLAVAENIFLGDEKRFLKKGVINRTALMAEAKRALAKIGVTDIDPARPAAAYSLETRKLVEVARAVYYDPTLFIVDETTTALSHTGRETIYKLMRDLKAKGKAVLFISHDLPELIALCDALTVLRDGRQVDTIEKPDFDEDQIKKAMVGREIKGDYYRSDYDASHGERVVLEARALTGSEIKSVDLTLHEGEIIGIGGLSGCGMHQLGRLLFGIDKAKSGGVTALDAKTGELTAVKDIESALQHSIGYVSKDRDKDALILPASIKDNLAVSALHKMKKIISPRAVKKFAGEQIDSLSIKCSSPNQSVGELSGGNKQKVSFGKWIGNGSKILILDSPTRGVDVGVKTTMYQLIYRLKKAGYAILIISEELPELIGMADSVIVMKDGVIAKRFVRSSALRDTDMIAYMI
jgi:ribose transport system ATP-binding protein